MPLALVTGGNGFIAAWVIRELANAGFTVRATARSQAKCGRDAEYVVVDDITLPGAFDDAVRDVELVFHVASPLVRTAVNVTTDIVEPAVRGTLSILESCVKTSSVKRVVITSSIAACLKTLESGSGAHVNSEQDWTTPPLDAAVSLNEPVLAYICAKMQAERAAWDFMQSRQPHFALTTVLPSLVFGPVCGSVASTQTVNLTNSYVWSLIDGQSIPPTLWGDCVDVRDVAKAHLLAATSDKARNQRYIVSAHPFKIDDILTSIGRVYPESVDRLPTVREGLPDFSFAFSNGKLKNDLMDDFISFDDMIRDTLAQRFETERKSTQ